MWLALPEAVRRWLRPGLSGARKGTSGKGKGRPKAPRPPRQVEQNVDILFLPHKDYHVRTVAALRPYLARRGLTVAVVDFAAPYRDEGVAAAVLLDDVPMLLLSDLDRDVIGAGAVVCFNDWEKVIRRYLSQFRRAGTPTVGLVEGVQDYHDADTGRPRHAYQTVETVLVPGQFDQRYFTGETQVGGLANVERLWLADFIAPSPARAVANVNFSYRVLTEERDEWVRGVDDACRAAQVDLVLSQHPADLGDLSNYRVSDQSIYQDLTECNILISRFSTVILEALAMGRRAIYFNPHGEKVDKFVDGAAAPVARSVDELTALLREMRAQTSDTRRDIAEYLAYHCAVDPMRQHQVVAERVANALADIVARSRKSAG